VVARLYCDAVASSLGIPAETWRMALAALGRAHIERGPLLDLLCEVKREVMAAQGLRHRKRPAASA